MALIIAVRAEAVPDCKAGTPVPGLTDAAGLAGFDRELRASLAAGDAVALSLLSRFPLRVNMAGGTIRIANATALQDRFEEVFPPPLRSAVAGSEAGSIVCRGDRIGYARGQLWASATEHGFYIDTVNVPGGAGDVASGRVSVRFTCRNRQRRVVVDSDGDGNLRYRSWQRHNPLSGDPDLEIDAGVMDVEGTGPCAHRLWTFKQGDRQYVVDDGEGCFAEAPPEGARGSVTIRAEGQAPTRDWCY